MTLDPKDNAIDQAALLDALLPAILAAGRAELAHFRSGVAVTTKPDQTPVTAADREAEAILLRALSQIAPGIAVVAEEAMAEGHTPVALGRLFFLVDPLDGTKEFINGRAEFTINVALVANGKPTFGVIYAPVTGEFYATTGPDRAIKTRLDAQLDDQSARAKLASAKTIHARRPPATGLIAVTSYSHMNAETRQLLAALPVAKTLSAGSSLKFCRVAEGQADIYPRVGRTAEWDIAAGHAILSAAGGSLLTPDGQPLVYGKIDQRFLNPSYVARGLLG